MSQKEAEAPEKTEDKAAEKQAKREAKLALAAERRKMRMLAKQRRRRAWNATQTVDGSHLFTVRLIVTFATLAYIVMVILAFVWVNRPLK